LEVIDIVFSFQTQFTKYYSIKNKTPLIGEAFLLIILFSF